ncbi:MAG: acyltransferase family protein [Oscillospiraceae bacterium]|nr:acyltransferase family protein [Oscillospiraceae bacterium]
MKKRETELDILRLLALLAVIWVHVGGMETDSLPTSDPDCQWLIFLKSIMTWEIPVYVMISGRFFLDPEREMPFSKIRKVIARLVIAFVVWDIVYQAYYILTDVYSGLNWKGILSQALVGPYHFWYLYMIAGMYLITPFLRKIVEDKRLSEYFIGLFLLFVFLSKYGVELPLVGATVGSMLDSMGMKFVLGYSGYYILGYYLRKYPLPDKWERLLYVCGTVLLLWGAAANTWQSVQNGAYTEQYTGYTAPNTIIAASAMYTLFSKRICKAAFSEKTVRWITKLAEYSFGVYLIHALVLDVFAAAGLKPTILHPILAMPLITLLAFAVTNVLVILIRKNPGVGRKIT